MTVQFTRRTLMAAGGASAITALTAQNAFAQGKPKMRFSAAFPETDLRAEGYKAFAAAMKDDIDFEPYWNNTLFKQGTELVALQRENLELCNLAPADISKQIPAWSLMTSAYLFRDYDHLNKTWKSDVGQEFIKMARDQLGIELIRPVFFGARQVNLKPNKKINTPADLAGVKLRMPPGEFWQFLGESLGANPTPVAYAELYTALQAGAVDGQDNPLVSGRSMKFYEVTSRFILTNHVLGYDKVSKYSTTCSLEANPSGSRSNSSPGKRSCHAGPFATSESQRSERHRSAMRCRSRTRCDTSQALRCSLIARPAWPPPTISTSTASFDILAPLAIDVPVRSGCRDLAGGRWRRSTHVSDLPLARFRSKRAHGFCATTYVVEART